MCGGNVVARIGWVGVLMLVALVAGASLGSRGARAQGSADCYARCNDSLNQGMCRGMCDTAGPTPSGPARPPVYGAIATTKAEFKMEYGTASGFSSQDAASAAAVADCDKRAGGKGRCEMDIWFYNQCAALAVGNDGHSSSHYAGSRLGAERSAMRYCQDGKKRICKIVTSFCAG